jgi:hypothetical protein
MATPTVTPRSIFVKPTRETGRPHKTTNYAELVTGRSILVNSGSNQHYVGLVELG